MTKLSDQFPKVMALHGKVAELPQLQHYLKSRIPFSDGLFRHYDELDDPR